MNHTPRINDLAFELLDEMIHRPDFFSIKIKKTSTGPTIIDAGIEAKGSLEAGRLITEICMGGLAKAEIIPSKFDDLEFLAIFVRTNHPAVAVLGSQLAGWKINWNNYSAIGSGPARALALKPKNIYQEIGYEDRSRRAVIVLETESYPPAEVTDKVSQECKIKPDQLSVILTPTTSMAGSVQISGRIVEVGMHKLRRLGINPKTILEAWGSSPIPPPHPKPIEAMARTNDSILYGGIAYYVIDHPNEKELKNVVNKASSSASDAYGRPFIEIFKQAKFDFFNIDSDLFAPAMLIVYNSRTGNAFKSGRTNNELLRQSFNLQKIRS